MNRFLVMVIRRLSPHQNIIVLTETLLSEQKGNGGHIEWQVIAYKISNF
jgi:hypothetical protein